MTGKKGLLIWWGEHWQRIAVCGSPAMESKNILLIRDLPMPGSPHSNATWPAPRLACSQKFNSLLNCSSRPTKRVSRFGRIASNRLSKTHSLLTLQASTGIAFPLTSTRPRSSQTNALPSKRCVLAATRTEFGAANCCKWAARFGVSPKTACSRADPSPMVSPMTTNPVAMPTLTCTGLPEGSRSFPMFPTMSSPARTARSASSS